MTNGSIFLKFVTYALYEKYPLRSFFQSVFSRIRTETEIYSVFFRIQSKCRKIRTRKNSVFGHFSRSDEQQLMEKHTFQVFLEQSQFYSMTYIYQQFSSGLLVLEALTLKTKYLFTLFDGNLPCQYQQCFVGSCRFHTAKSSYYNRSC